MDTRSYLGMMKNIDRRIKNKLDEAQRWRDIAEGRGVQNFDNDRVQTSQLPDMMAQAVVNALECERRASDMAIRLTKVKAQIIDQLDGLEDELHYNLLYGFYIENQNHTDLAAQEGYTYRNIKRKFEDALKAFERAYGETYLKK